MFAQRSNWDESSIVAVHHLAGRDARAQLALGDERVLVDLFSDEDHELDAGAVTLELQPYAAHWFRLRRPGQRLAP